MGEMGGMGRMGIMGEMGDKRNSQFVVDGSINNVFFLYLMFFSGMMAEISFFFRIFAR